MSGVLDVTERREGATVLVVVSECGDERVLQMTEDEAKELRDILAGLLVDDEEFDA